MRAPTSTSRTSVESKSQGHARRVRAVPAVTRAIAILRLLGSSASPLGLKAIAQTLDLVPSTCLHILRALVEEKLAKVNPYSKRYSLDVGMLPLGRAVLRNSSFATLVQPELDRLSKRYGLTAIGVEMLALEYMVVVALSRSPALLGLHVDVGSRFPALISASGRCVAAFGNHPWKKIEQRFRSLRWDNAPKLGVWRKEVESAKRKGYSIDRSNYINGIAIIAAPVLDANQHMAQGIVLLGLAEQINNSAAISIARDMRAAAETVAKQMYSH
ncbi:MAG: helix-turn-helix domain-containing protein [Betaproteobacteria bacterium]|nr:helix-turn-helix domain-containing protein [Betaproteobacteria bacterium]